MDLSWSPQHEQYRIQVCDFIESHAPGLKLKTGHRAPTSPEEEQALREWKGGLYDAGYLGSDWPVELGGTGQSDPLLELIVNEEMARAQMPPLNDNTTLASQALLLYGNDGQKSRYLPGIRRGEHIWCQLFSEPDAGSDLASLQTRATRDGDVYIVNGQKVWSTHAHWADYGLLLARTEPDAPKHQGISAFALDLKLTGVTVRPLRELTGTSDFNEVFFDNVAVPAVDLLGGPGAGWTVATGALNAERSGMGAGSARLKIMLSDLLQLACRSEGDRPPAIEDGWVRQEVGRLCCLVEAANLLIFSKIARESRGKGDAADAPIGKLVFSEVNLQIAETALKIQGSKAALSEDDAIEDGRWQEELLYGPSYTIAGGSSEIMRNILAERALGMPRISAQVR